MFASIRIKATDDLGYVSFINGSPGQPFYCTLPSGLPTCFSFAGILNGEVMSRRVLRNCANGKQALASVQKYGLSHYRYELLTPDEDDLVAAMHALAALEAEVHRLKQVISAAIPPIHDHHVADFEPRRRKPRFKLW